jgi:hypothetical protein
MSHFQVFGYRYFIPTMIAILLFILLVFFCVFSVIKTRFWMFSADDANAYSLPWCSLSALINNKIISGSEQLRKPQCSPLLINTKCLQNHQIVDSYHRLSSASIWQCNSLPSSAVTILPNTFSDPKFHRCTATIGTEFHSHWNLLSFQKYKQRIKPKR